MPGNMSQEEFLARIAAGAKNMNNPQDSGADPEVVKAILAQGLAAGQQPNRIERPDPEASANMQIARAASQGARSVQSNPINPDTGMPYFGAAPKLSPEDEQRRQMNEFKLQYLRNKSQGQ